MRRKIGIFVIFIFVISCLIVAITVLTKEDEQKGHDDEVSSIEKNKNEQKQYELMAKVVYGTIDSTHMCKGYVNNNEDNYVARMEYEVSLDDKIVLNVNIGDEVNIGDDIITINGKTSKSDVYGLVCDIVEYPASVCVSVIEYDRMYIEMDVPYEIYEKFGYDAEIKIIDGDSTLTGKVKNKGYCMEGDNVRTKVGFDGYIIPGKEVEVHITLGKTKEMLFILTSMVNTINGVNYCYVINENDEVEERIVEVGEVYTQVDDGYSTSYTEIISGLVEGDRIVVFK